MTTQSQKGDWYVVQTLTGHEGRVKDAMDRQLRTCPEDFPVYEVLIPTKKISEVKQGRRTTLSRKIFQGYIFIRVDLYDKEHKLREDAWSFILGVNGVIGFVGTNRNNPQPIPLSKSEVESLMLQVNEKRDEVVPKVDYELGENVRIKDGPFESYEGVVSGIDSERGKLKVMVSIFGRSTPIELEYWQVEKV